MELRPISDLPITDSYLKRKETEAFIHRQKQMLRWEFLDAALQAASDAEMEKIVSLRRGDKLSLSDGRQSEVRQR